jgi:predicted nucleic acid-binding protein
MADRGDAIVVPAAAYAEALVGPSRRGAASVAVLDEFVDALPAVIEPISRSVARRAAELRARHGARLRLSDAIVVAAGLTVGASQVVTTDARWPKLEISVEVLRAAEGPSMPAATS